MISFKSEHIGNAFIQEHLFCGLYNDKKSAIVEFNPKSLSDGDALKTIKGDWKKLARTKETFADDIYEDFVDFSKERFDEEHHFLGLTLQEDAFEKTDPSKILGIAEVARIDAGRFDDSEVFMLDYLETKPDCIHTINNREYKTVGKRLLDYVIYKFKELPIVVMPTKTSASFYLNNGFKWLSNGSDILILRR